MRYILFLEIKRLIKKDNVDLKQSVFLNFISRYPLAKNIYYLIQNSRFSPVFIFIFFVIKLFTLRFDHKEGGVLTFIQKENEQRSFEEIIDSDHKDTISKVEYASPVNFVNFFFARERRALLGQFYMAKKVLRIFILLCRRYNLLVCLRCSELIAIWTFMERSISAKDFSAVISFTDGNPNGLALFLFSKKYKKKLFFISHGQPAHPIYPLDCDFAYLLDKKSSEHYISSGAEIKQVIYHGVENQYREFKIFSDLNHRLSCIILLSKSDHSKNINAIIQKIRGYFGSIHVHIRDHPFLAKEKMLPLEQVIQSYNFAIATNTSSILTCLISGIPVIYTNITDDKIYDRYGFVQDGLVPRIERLS